MGAPCSQGVYRMIPFIARLILTLFCLGLVVVIHELGHLFVALRLGVRVERFTVGFGSELFGWTARVWSPGGVLHASGGGQCLYRPLPAGTGAA